MKTGKFLILLVITTFVVACSSENSKKENVEHTTILEKEDVITKYKLDLEKSIASWERNLHQGPTKKKMKLFGANVDVEMGEVELNTSGEVELTNGELKQTNDDYSSMLITFDMTTLKLNTDMESKSDDLFKTKEFHESILEISEIVNNGTNFTLKGELTIAEKTNPIESHVTIVDSNPGKILEGDFIIKTLDWPLREEEAKKSVITDEVEITLSLKFMN